MPDVALAPPCGDELGCSSDCEACSSVEVKRVETSLESMQLQLQLIMSKADYLQACFLEKYTHNLTQCTKLPGYFSCFLTFPVCSCRQGQIDTQALAAAVPNFLFSCQPYFNQLEAAAGGMESQLTPLPFDAYAAVHFLKFHPVY